MNGDGGAIAKTPSAHAVTRFLERSECDLTRKEACALLMEMLDHSEEVYLKAEYRELYDTRYGARRGEPRRPIRFFSSGPLILVVRDGVIVTVHRGEMNRWWNPKGGGP